MSPPALHRRTIPGARVVNDAILAGYARWKDHPSTRRSHWFGGRHENVYVPPGRIPVLEALLDEVRRHAGGILEQDPRALRALCWFNEMAPGQRTGLHTHDEEDELLSAVYYLRVPERSGDLLLHGAGGVVTVRPEEGLLLLFDPTLAHEVKENRSGATRLSLGINIGRRPTARAAPAGRSARVSPRQPG